jgi:hypothetical protein
VNTSSNVQGFEALGVLNLYEGPNVRFYGLAGYRFFQAKESLRIETDSALGTFGPPGIFTAHTVDEVDTNNLFNGGLLGLRTNVTSGKYFIELDTKVSLGNVQQIVDRSGLTAGTLTTAGGTTNTVSPYGIFVRSPNSGRFERNAVTLLPEGALRVGLNGKRCRIYVGYSVIYLSDVVRPADQLNRTIDLNSFINGTVSANGQPQGLVKSDFWVQGITLGFEFRY